jgi:hypothetical protein
VVVVEVVVVVEGGGSRTIARCSTCILLPCTAFMLVSNDTLVASGCGYVQQPPPSHTLLSWSVRQQRK